MADLRASLEGFLDFADFGRMHSEKGDSRNLLEGENAPPSRVNSSASLGRVF